MSAPATTIAHDLLVAFAHNEINGAHDDITTGALTNALRIAAPALRDIPPARVLALFHDLCDAVTHGTDTHQTADAILRGGR